MPEKYTLKYLNIILLSLVFLASCSSHNKNKPIEAYWKIVDQHNQPVSGVEINATISYLGFPQQFVATQPKRRTLVLTSDSDGRFKVKGLSGLNLGFGGAISGKQQIKKPNYSFEHVIGLGESDFQNRTLTGGSSLNNPIIIHAYKRKGYAPRLMIGKKKLKKLIPDGRNYEIVMEEGKHTSQHKKASIYISFHRPAPLINQRDKPEWSVKMSVRDEGGFIESNDPLMYDAPEAGYQDIWELNHEEKSKDWVSQAKRNFYFKTKNGQVYGRINVIFFPFYSMDGNSAVSVKYWVNVDGFRNLFSERIP